MGREIRRVIPHWEHPTESKPNHKLGRMEEVYIPMFDRSYLLAITEWIEGHEKWESGEDPDRAEHPEYRYYAEWHGNPPCAECYRPDWTEEQMTWYQMYETVSEGTPVTPPFATQQELVDYLVEHGDFWDQQRRAEGNSCMPCAPWSREQAEKFVFGSGYMPSMIVTNGKIHTGSQIMDL